MNTIDLLYPRFVPIVLDFLLLSHKANMPVVIFSARRTLAENAAIYPSEPLRWSNHIAGVAVDVYPAEYHAWPSSQFQSRFNDWPHWGNLRDIAAAAGMDSAQKFNDTDRDHFQCLFGTSGIMLKMEFLNYKGTEDQKLQNVWHYLDTHKGV